MRLQALSGYTKFLSPADEGGAPAPEPAAPPPAPAAVVEPAVAPAAPAQTPAAEAIPGAGAPAAAPATDWRDRRIAELTAKLNDERRAKAAAPAGPAAGETPEQFQARVDAAANEKAAEIAALNDWNTRCNSVNDQGVKEFPDWATRLSACRSVVNPQDGTEVAQFNAVLAAAMETGQAHKLLHSMGETPGEVKRLMALPPMKMAMEMATRAAKIGAGPPAPEPSGAPRPITPIGSHGAHYEGLDPSTPNGTKLPIGEWMKQREKQAETAGIQ